MGKRTEQEEFWKGDFGDEYIARNTKEWRITGCISFFREALSYTEKDSVKTICEFGANIGDNLLALKRINEGFGLYAVEINRKAFEILQSRDMGIEEARNCSIIESGYGDNSFDLTFTSGVLIHINPDTLYENVAKIVSASKRYVLINEYFSHQPTEVLYRGHEGKLFKRDFGSFLLDNFPGLSVVHYGFVWKMQNPSFDNTNWWLFEKGKSS